MFLLRGIRKSEWNAMGKVFKLNLAGLNELMKSQEMAAVLDQAANVVAHAVGDGYEIEKAHPIQFVGISAVHASTYKAKLDNSKNNTLLKAVGGARI